MAKKRGKAQKKTKQLQEQRGENDDVKKAPHSFVIHRGIVPPKIERLTRNMRKVMSPFTAEALKENSKNTLKDFITIAGPLNVSHMIMFTQSEKSVNLRICRLPRGPTLTFKVDSYTTIRDLARTIRKHDENRKYFRNHALLIMNNFSKESKHLKLTASMFQNMFPSLNINSVKLRSIKRIVLVNYNEETDQVEFRHYLLRVVPVGVSRPMKKLTKKSLPKLARYNDISQFLLNPGALSESEVELDGEHNEVELPQNMPGKGNAAHEQSAIRLREIGPRMSLTLTKITNGVCSGDVIYHKFIQKSEAEIKQMERLRAQKQALKEKRRAEQEARVKQKANAKQAQKEKSRIAVGLPAKQTTEENGEDDSDDQTVTPGAGALSDSELDDAEYYEKEVGEKPDKDMFAKKAKKRTAGDAAPKHNKRFRPNEGRPQAIGKPAAKSGKGGIPAKSNYRGRPENFKSDFTGGVKSKGGTKGSKDSKMGGKAGGKFGSKMAGKSKGKPGKKGKFSKGRK